MGNVHDKITWIRSDLGAVVNIGPVDVTMALAGPAFMDSFPFLRPDDVDRTLGKVKATTCLLDPCPSWLIHKSCQRERERERD